MSSAGLHWTGHALVDVGLAGVCALTGRARPEEVTLDDLDAASDFIAEHYFSGALDPYLTVVFTSNSGYCGPNKAKTPADYEEVYRAHRVAPGRHLTPASGGARCAFSGGPASVFVHRQHLPLFSAEGVLNFRPGGETAVPITAACLVALQFTPMAARRAEGRMLAVHADDPALTLAFARRYLEDNRRLLSLALPATRAPVHAEFGRERPMWDPQKKRHKMADAKGPRSLVLADLTAIASEAGPTDLRPTPSALHVYLLSNSGQGPSIDVLALPSGVVGFVRRAAQSRTQAAWAGVAASFRPLKQADDDEPASGRGQRRKSAAAAIPGRAGWSRNPAFEELCQVFEAGFTDRQKARAWLGRHVLGRIESRAGDVRYQPTRARHWALGELFLQEVLGMKAARIEAIKKFADKLAEHVQRTRNRKLFRALTFDKPRELRAALLRAQRETATPSGVLFGLDEYATVWLHEDGEEYLVRDLVCIRMVERLAEIGWFEANPDDRLDQADEVQTDEEAEA